MDALGGWEEWMAAWALVLEVHPLLQIQRAHQPPAHQAQEGRLVCHQPVRAPNTAWAASEALQWLVCPLALQPLSSPQPHSPGGTAAADGAAWGSCFSATSCFAAGGMVPASGAAWAPSLGGPFGLAMAASDALA